MKINGLKIDGYGVWSGLEIEKLSDGVNVLYGPNEAGKTTLLQFVRSMLYGFSPSGRRYFPPVHGGRPGGSIELAGPNGRFCLDRHYDENDDGANDVGNREQLTLTAADGTRQGEHLIKVLLSHVDEAIFNNVFAVGLREMQELGSLGDTEAADLLYNITAGLDRVSLVEVIRELENLRNRILDGAGGQCQISELLARREKLRQEIEELGRLTQRYGRLAAEQNSLQRELTRLEEENNAVEHQARVVELAITLRERWARRSALDDELSVLGVPETMPEDAVERIDVLNARIEKHSWRIGRLHSDREQLRAEAAELPINEALSRQSARIEALLEQESWIADLQEQIDKLEAEIAEIETALATEHKQLGLGKNAEPGALPRISAGTLSAMRPPARTMRGHRQDLVKAKQAVTDANETARSLVRQIEAGLAARGRRDLAEAMDCAGELVSQLRRRLQIDERLDEMGRYQTELEGQSRQLVDRQMLPVWVLFALGAVFVFGMVLVMAGLFMPTSITGSVGWALAVFGLAGTGAAAGVKVVIERSNTRQLDTCQKQIGMLQMQIKTAKEERETLDAKLPRGGGPIAVRLDAAESDLAALEELTPLETRRTAALQEAEAAARRVAQAKSDLAAARRRWSEVLTGAGLPGGLMPKQVRQIARRCDQIGELQRRLAACHEELQRRRGEFDSLCGRIRRLVDDACIDVSADRPVEQLRLLGEAVVRQESHVERHGVLRRQAGQIRRKRAKHEAAVSKFKHLRRRLLHECGANDEQNFRRMAVQAARAEVLRRERDVVAGQINAAIGGICPEDAVEGLLEGDEAERLEVLRDEMLDRLGVLENQLQERFVKRGQLTEQLKTLADDRQLADKQLESAVLEKRLDDAVRRWQVLAVTCRTLETIRVVYEKERQPETLQEASGYLDRLTGGRYRRVWTPLGEDVLMVDDAEGNSLSVEVLSRGTREQLFLGLRLALAASYARHGAPLPLVLDDVLVNFDADRAKAAAAVLRDFAAAGHQLLVFTCHEHILKLFKSLKVPVSRLPDNAEADPAPVTFEQPAKKSSRKSKRSARKPKVVEEPQEEELVEDEEDADWSEDEFDEEEYDDEYDDDTAEAA